MKNLYFNYNSDSTKRGSGDLYFSHIISKYLPKRKDVKIFELGCGSGNFIKCASELGYSECSGIDISELQISKVDYSIREKVKCADALVYLDSVQSDSIDCLIALDFIEHFSVDDVSGMLDSIYRIMTYDGILIIHVPNGSSPFCGRMRYSDITHKTAYTASSIEQLLLMHNFSNIQCVENKPLFNGIHSLFRMIGWFLIRNLYRLFLFLETGVRNEIFSQNMVVICRKIKI